MKRVILVIFVLLISLSLVNANNYSESDALLWLSTHVTWGTAPIEEVSFALLALESNNYDTTSGLSFLKGRVSSSGCYSSIPSGSCTTKDTALAALALAALGEDIDPQLNWINDSLVKADIEGDWIIQIIPNGGEGECNFTGAGNSIIKEVNGESEWFSIENDLEMIINDPLETINVDCDLSSNTKISLIRTTTENEFYIIEQKIGNDVNIVVNSACYSQSQTGSCDVDSSFYVSWALEKLGEDVNTLPYLQDSISENNVYYAILNTLSSNQEYVDILLAEQNAEGYWSSTISNIYGTSFVIDSLYSYPLPQEVTNAINWLEEEQVNSGINTGSWNDGNVLDTSVALFLGLTHAFSGGNLGNPPVGFCSDGIIQSPNQFGEFEECDDGNTLSGDGCSSFCNLEGGECISNLDCVNVGEICNLQTNTCELDPLWCTDNSMCGQGEFCDLTINKCQQSLVYCETNADCEFYQYCDLVGTVCKTSSGYCSTDLDCNYNQECDFISHICVLSPTGGFEDKTPDTFEDEGTGSLWWVWLIIIIIILGGGVFAYFYFSKPKKKNNGRPSFLEPQRPTQPPMQPQQPRSFARPRRDEALESELDRSIREAQDLLRKKK